MGLGEVVKLLVELNLGGNLKTGIAGVERQLSGLSSHTNRISGGFKTLGTGFLVAGIRATALLAAQAGAVAGAVGAMVKEGAEAAKVEKIYATAVANSGKVSTQYVDILNKQQTALMNLSGADDELIKSQQTQLITMGLTGAQVAKLTPLILDAATSTGRDIAAVTLAVGKAALGSTGALGRIGIILPKTAAATKSAALATLEHSKLQLKANEAQAKSHGVLSKSQKALWAHRKAVLDAAIAQQKLTDASKKGSTAAGGFDTVVAALTKRFGGAAQAVSGSLDVRLNALRENLANIREEAGMKLLPAITRIVDVAGKDLVPAFGKFIDRILPSVIAGVDKFASLLENGGAERGIKAITDALGPMVEMLKLAAAPVKAIVTAFLALPSQVQGVLIGAFAVNKLSGGLILGGAGQIAGGLLQRGSSPANPLFVSDVSGGGALGAAGKGGLGTVLKFVGAIGLATVALDLWQNSLVPLNEANATQTKTIGENVKAGLKDASIDVLKSQRGALIEGLTKIGGITQGLGPLQGVLFGGQIEGLKADIAAIDAELGRRKSPIAQFTRNFAVAGSPIAQFTTHLGSIASTLTKVQQELRTDFRAAVAALRDAANPADMLAAVARLVVDVKGGVGGPEGTKALVADLTARRNAAAAIGDQATADALTAAIKSIEPFVKGREWQREQIAQGRKILNSNKTTAEKVKELKGIQAELLRHQDTSAARQVQQMLDLIMAVKNINIGNAFTPSREGDNGPVKPKDLLGGHPFKSFDGGGLVTRDMFALVHRGEYVLPSTQFMAPDGSRWPSKAAYYRWRQGQVPLVGNRGHGPMPLVVNANVSVSTRDVNTSQSVRSRYGPTPAEVGAA